MSDEFERGTARGPEPYDDADTDDVCVDGLSERKWSALGNLSGAFGALRGQLHGSRLLWASTIGLCVVAVGLVSSYALTAGLRGSLPPRAIGITDATPDSGGNTVPVSVRSGQRLAQTEVTGSDAPHIEAADRGSRNNFGYLPDRDAPAGTVITVPTSQGRLLRFDEPVESVFIADPDIADVRVVSSDLVYVYGKTPGLTNLMAVSARASKQDNASGTEQQVTASALLRVVMDTRPANEARREWAPSAPVDISVFGRRTAVRGLMPGIDQAVAAANIAETFSPRDQIPLNNTTLAGPNQINIRVRFAEASRTDLRSFGIDWNVAAGGGSFRFGVAKTGATQNPNLNLGVRAGNFDIDLLIEALQASGALTILAEPNLTAVTGETASFLAGGEVPIPVPNGNNGDSITVQYKPFGVSLAFTPTMVKENRIALRVKPEVSSISDTTNFSVQGFNLPSFTVRRAETVIEMASGQTFAMAGLFQRDITRNVDKLPLLGDVPVLGQLFRSERYQRNETELVILITPYLVDPVSDRSLATPLDRAGASPWQANIVADPTAKGAGLTGSHKQSGFILK